MRSPAAPGDSAVVVATLRRAKCLLQKEREFSARFETTTYAQKRAWAGRCQFSRHFPVERVFDPMGQSLIGVLSLAVLLFLTVAATGYVVFGDSQDG